MTITNSLVYANGLTGLCTALYCLPYIYSLKAFVLLQGFLRYRVSIKEPIDSLVSIHVSFHVFGSNITCCLYAHKSFWKRCLYRVFIKYCVFTFKYCDFSELCQFCCSAGVLPAWRVYTHWHQGKTEKDQSPEYSKIFGKNTIFNEHPVPQQVS